MAADSLQPVGAEWNLGHGAVAGWSVGLPLAVVLVTSISMSVFERKLRRGRVPGPFIAADHVARIARILLLVIHLAAVLVFDWLETVRAFVSDTILVDELVAISPALFGLIGIWWAYYPIDCRIHQATLIRRLDEGEAVYPMLTRGGYVLLQTRVHLLLMLVPVLMIAGLSEAFTKAAENSGVFVAREWAVDVGRVAIAAGVFLMAPLLARMMLDVQPMSDGPMRNAMLAVCSAHRVRIRELLVWRTNGTVFNAAVMGLIGPLRYVLMTDALLESMREEQVCAVMAHEIGHVRRRHMVWMVICLIASFALAAFLLQPTVVLAEQLPMLQSQRGNNGFWMFFNIAQIVIALIIFAWICRRFERQADTFAVQHLSIHDPQQAGHAENAITRPDSETIVQPHAVYALCNALDAIAQLNTIDRNRFSWRHGSIAWRMDYLVGLIGKPVHRLAIDRQVRRIKIASVFIVIAGAAISIIAAQAGMGAT